jgi:hypothetical protein
LAAERKHGSNGSYLDRSVLPTTERELLCSQDYPAVWGSPRVSRFWAGSRHALTQVSRSANPSMMVASFDGAPTLGRDLVARG